MGGKGKRGGRKPLPPAPQPRESWVPQTAARRDICRFPYGADDDEPEARTRPLTDAEIIEAAEKYRLPDNTPVWVAESMTKRDMAHQMTLPGFAITRWHMYHAKRPVVVASSCLQANSSKVFFFLSLVRPHRPEPPATGH